MPPKQKTPARQPTATADSNPSSDPTSPQDESSAAAVVLREFTPEQNTMLQARFDSLNSAIDAKIDDRFDKMMAQLKNWMSGQNAAQHEAQHAAPNPADPAAETDLFDSIEKSPPPPPHPPILQRSDPAETPPTSYRSTLRAKDVGFFNPDTPEEHGLGPVATVSSETVFRDVYTWVERLKDLIYTHGPDEVRWIIQPCLRGSAATWWIAELTDEDRRKLRNSELQRWFSLLIKRFKLQTSVALSRLVSQSYSSYDLGRSPRIWIHQMLHYARAAEIDSTFNQLTIIWNRFDANLRRDIPMPKPHTRLADFLDQIDVMYPTWVDIKKSGYRQHGFQPRDPQRDPHRDPQRDPQRDSQRNPHPPSQRDAHPQSRSRGFPYEQRARAYHGVVDGGAQWEQEDQNFPPGDDDYAD